MPLLVGWIFARRKWTQRGDSACAQSEAIPLVLESYGYLARNAQEWHTRQTDVDLSIRITNHAEVKGHTQYHVECAITWPAADASHIVHTWALEVRLKYFRKHLHDPVKQELAGNYNTLFRHARFARRGGLNGTTKRLNIWLCRLAEIINSRTVSPVIVARVLQALNVPAAPVSDEPCVSSIQLSTTMTEVFQLADVCNSSSEDVVNVLEALGRKSCIDGHISTGVPSPATTRSDAGETYSDEWSDLGLSDDDDESLVDAYAGDDANLGMDITSACFEVLGNSGERLPSVSPTCSLSSAGQLPESTSRMPVECSMTLNERLQDVGVSDPVPKVFDAECRWGVQLRRAGSKEPSSCIGEKFPRASVELRHVEANPPKRQDSTDSLATQVQLRPVNPVHHSQEKAATNSFLEKLRARKEIVDWQKISGRGKLF
jgi:hypothetical protein